MNPPANVIIAIEELKPLTPGTSAYTAAAARLGVACLEWLSSGKRARVHGKYPPGFKAWWSLYPPIRRYGKPQCLKKWLMRKLESEYEDQIMRLERWKRSPEWTREGGAYIPNPHRYLNEERDQSVISATDEPHLHSNPAVAEIIKYWQESRCPGGVSMKDVAHIENVVHTCGRTAADRKKIMQVIDDNPNITQFGYIESKINRMAASEEESRERARRARPPSAQTARCDKCGAAAEIGVMRTISVRGKDRRLCRPCRLAHERKERKRLEKTKHERRAILKKLAGEAREAF